MKKIIVCLLTLVVAFSFTATKNVKASGQPITVSVSRDTINIAVDIAGGGDAQLYAYDANAYYTSDPLKGISKRSSDQGELVGTYTCGSGHLFTRPRYNSQGEDRLYQKYYVIQNGKILAGPVYASIIENNKKIDIAQKSIKGIFVDDYGDLKYATKLKANSITINIGLNNFIYPFYTKKQDSGDSLQAPPAKDAIPFESNGKTFYFRNGSVTGLDATVSYATKHHMNVVGILIPWRRGGNSAYPNALRYNDKSKYPTQGMNTSTQAGEDYYIAMMEFLASRYSQGKKHGLISTYFVSNEVDFTPYFFDCGDFNTYMEELSRCLRLTNLAVKKYASDIRVVVPFTHYWAGYEKKMFKECKGNSYRPLDMMNWLIKYTNKRGAYDWGIAPHVFGTFCNDGNLARSDTKWNVLSNNYKTSKQITYSNLEVLKNYLSQSKARYNGQIRKIYMTEAGISTGAKDTSVERNNQAASIAQVYYKSVMLDFVKTFNYFRVSEHFKDGSYTAQALLDLKDHQKAAYNVYKYIDTNNSFTYANKYLKYISYKRNGKTQVSFANGKIKSWKETMTVYSGKTNWNKLWNISKVLPAQYRNKGLEDVKNVSVKKASTKSITLKWSKNKRAQGYEINVKGYKKFRTTKNTYTIKKLKKEKKYNITIRPYHKIKGKRVLGLQTDLVAYASGHAYPVTVYGVTAGKKSITVNYARSPFARGYQISYKMTKDKKWKTVNTKVLKKKITRLKSKKTYQVRVRALDRKGKGTSKYTKTYRVKVK